METYRTISVRTSNRDNEFKVDFSTPQQYNKVYNALMSKKSADKSISIENPDNRLDIDANSVLYFYHSDEQITQIKDSMKILSIVFEDKSILSVTIQGVKRAKHAYEAVKILIDKDPTNMFISLLQEDNKYALVRHYCKIKELYMTNVLNGRVSING